VTRNCDQQLWCATSRHQHFTCVGVIRRRLDGWSGDVRPWPWHLNRRRPHHENSRSANRVVLFCCTPSVATDSPAHTTRHVPDIGGSVSSVANGLRQWRTCRVFNKGYCVVYWLIFIKWWTVAEKTQFFRVYYFSVVLSRCGVCGIQTLTVRL